MTRLRPLLLVAVLALTATVASALEPAACLRTWENESGQPLSDGSTDSYPLRNASGRLTDMGQGIVADFFETEASDSRREGVVFHQCGSGLSLVVESGTWRAGRMPEVYPDPFAVMQAALASSRTMTLAEVQETFFVENSFMVRAVNVEACACAVFYPELRGNRTPWSS